MATMTLKPDSGQPGAAVEVHAEGFQPNEEVGVHRGSLAGEATAIDPSSAYRRGKPPSATCVPTPVCV